MVSENKEYNTETSCKCMYVCMYVCMYLLLAAAAVEMVRAAGGVPDRRRQSGQTDSQGQCKCSCTHNYMY